MVLLAILVSTHILPASSSDRPADKGRPGVNPAVNFSQSASANFSYTNIPIVGPCFGDNHGFSDITSSNYNLSIDPSFGARGGEIPGTYSQISPSYNSSLNLNSDSSLSSVSSSSPRLIPIASPDDNRSFNSGTSPVPGLSLSSAGTLKAIRVCVEEKITLSNETLYRTVPFFNLLNISPFVIKSEINISGKPTTANSVNGNLSFIFLQYSNDNLISESKSSPFP